MNFYDEVLDVLKSDERFFSDDAQLLRNAVYEAAMQMDSKLIKALYANEETRKHFFTDVDGIAVFDKVGFGWVINNREFLPDSYCITIVGMSPVIAASYILLCVKSVLTLIRLLREIMY